jgi:catechol 2,3-dioxygenase-like lactoylglutathione lyase family enzyme
MGEMKYMGIGQVAINVDDLDAAVRDYTEIFGMQFTVVDVPEINVRAAVSDGGIVFAEPLDKTKEQPVSKYHNGALAAIEVRVSDLEEARRRLEEKGIEPIYYMDTQGGLIEYYMKQFHGIPLTIFEMKTESWVEAIGGDDFDPSTYTYNLTWSDAE